MLHVGRCGICAANALFIVVTALLAPGDYLVVVRPNYATKLETPRAIGCEISFIDLELEEGFRLDLSKVVAAITPRTKIVSITCPHSPTGVVLSTEDMRRWGSTSSACPRFLRRTVCPAFASDG